MSRDPEAGPPDGGPPPTAGPGAGGEDEIRRLVVAAPGAHRLDRFLAGAMDVSRTRAARWVERGHVRVDGREAKKSEELAAGAVVEVSIPPPEPVDAAAQDIPLDIVFEDAHLLVVDKPAGMVVHPAPGHHSGTLVNALLHHVSDLSGMAGRLRPGIVHRLDRDTSGLLVVAKTDAVHAALSEALRRREIRRVYLAAAWGHLRSSPLRIDAPIARDPRDRKRMAVVDGGRPARTSVRVRERWTGADLLDVRLHTGRTHQIRVHLLHLGHPVVGDSTYGTGWERGISGASAAWARAWRPLVPRQFLHARGLAFRHPVTGEDHRFEAPLPDDLLSAATSARERG